MQKKRIIFAAALLLAMRLVWAADGEASNDEGASSDRLPETAQIKVAGLKHQASFDFAMIQRGLEAFAAHHSLAPGASLRFAVRDPKHAPLTDLKVSFVDEDNNRLVLPVDDEDSFALPGTLTQKGAEAWIVVNRKSGSVEVSPRIQSPKLSESQRRLGDLRLECEVMWAMKKDTAPLFIRVAAKMTAGICHSPHFTLNKQVTRRITAAQLVQGDRKVSLPLAKSGYAYIPPLYDRSWSDDASVVLEFAR